MSNDDQTSRDSPGEERPPGAAATLSGRLLDGRYAVQGTIGAGGVGVVYRAVDRRLDRQVAVKVILKEYVANKALRLRFEREAKALAALSHPNIVAVTDYGVDGDTPFLVMELLEGQTLKERLDAVGPLSEAETLDITRQLLTALAFAHDQKLVHRDLKPGNVFLRPLESGSLHASILDFGLAKFVTGDEGRDGPQLTVTGTVFGTPAYMSPEQCVGSGVGPAADLYAIGVVVYEMLSGRLPFYGETKELLRQHLLVEPPALSEVCQDRTPTPAVQDYVTRALRKSSRERHASARDMLESLEALPRPWFLPEADAVSEPMAAATGADGLAASPDAAPTSEELATQRTMAEGFPAPAPAPAPAPKPTAEAERQRFSTQPTEAAGMPVVSPAPPAAVHDVDGPREPTPAPRATTAGAKADTPQTSSTSAARSRQLLIIVAVVVVMSLVGIVAGVIALFAFGGDDAEAGAGPTSDGTPPSGVPLPTPAPGLSGQPSPASPTPTSPRPGRGPLETAPLPPLMASAKRTLDRGERLNRSVEKQLRAQTFQDRSDPRPLLLLARNKVLRGSLTDAVDRYERAFDASPTARNDPHMLPDLVRIAGSTATRRATRALEQIYGATAIPAIDAALAQPDVDRQRAARLRQTRELLAGGR